MSQTLDQEGHLQRLRERYVQRNKAGRYRTKRRNPIRPFPAEWF